MDLVYVKDISSHNQDEEMHLQLNPDYHLKNLYSY